MYRCSIAPGDIFVGTYAADQCSGETTRGINQPLSRDITSTLKQNYFNALIVFRQVGIVIFLYFKVLQIVFCCKINEKDEILFLQNC